jgi:hypothetical protein
MFMRSFCLQNWRLSFALLQTDFIAFLAFESLPVPFGAVEIGLAASLSFAVSLSLSLSLSLYFLIYPLGISISGLRS